MRNYKNILWAVPLYCVIAEIASFHILVAIVVHFAIITSPDRAITTDDTKTMAILECLLKHLRPIYLFCLA